MKGLDYAPLWGYHKDKLESFEGWTQLNIYFTDADSLRGRQAISCHRRDRDYFLLPENTGLHIASMGEGKGGEELTMYKQKWLIAFLLTPHLSPESVFLRHLKI